jgi:hypothetical protein
MSAPAWAQFGLLAGLVLLRAPLVGRYMAAVFGGGRAPGDRMFLPVELYGRPCLSPRAMDVNTPDRAGHDETLDL